MKKYFLLLITVLFLFSCSKDSVKESLNASGGSRILISGTKSVILNNSLDYSKITTKVYDKEGYELVDQKPTLTVYKLDSTGIPVSSYTLNSTSFTTNINGRYKIQASLNGIVSNELLINAIEGDPNDNGVYLEQNEFSVTPIVNNDDYNKYFTSTTFFINPDVKSVSFTDVVNSQATGKRMELYVNGVLQPKANTYVIPTASETELFSLTTITVKMIQTGGGSTLEKLLTFKFKRLTNTIDITSFVAKTNLVNITNTKPFNTTQNDYTYDLENPTYLDYEIVTLDTMKLQYSFNGTSYVDIPYNVEGINRRFTLNLRDVPRNTTSTLKIKAITPNGTNQIYTFNINTSVNLGLNVYLTSPVFDGKYGHNTLFSNTNIFNFSSDDNFIDYNSLQFELAKSNPNARVFYASGIENPSSSSFIEITSTSVSIPLKAILKGERGFIQFKVEAEGITKNYTLWYRRQLSFSLSDGTLVEAFTKESDGSLSFNINRKIPSLNIRHWESYDADWGSDNDEYSLEVSYSFVNLLSTIAYSNFTSSLTSHAGWGISFNTTACGMFWSQGGKKHKHGGGTWTNFELAQNASAQAVMNFTYKNIPIKAYVTVTP